MEENRSAEVAVTDYQAHYYIITGKEGVVQRSSIKAGMALASEKAGGQNLILLQQ